MKSAYLLKFTRFVKSKIKNVNTTSLEIPKKASEIELLESLKISDIPDPIGKYLDSKGGGIHHLALQVFGLALALKELKDKGVKLIDESPRTGANDTQVAFIHPKSTGGFLIELVEGPVP